MRTLHGMLVHGFPNCFIMNNIQAGFTASYPHLLDEQAVHLAYIVESASSRGAGTAEVSAAGEAEWIERCIDKANLAREFFENCTPGYYNNEGKPSERSAQNGFYGGGSAEYFRLLAEWRQAGDLRGVELKTSHHRGTETQRA